MVDSTFFAVEFNEYSDKKTIIKNLLIFSNAQIKFSITTNYVYKKLSTN